MLSENPSSMMVLSSYEPSNIGHRNSRMRAASELEDLGIIDHQDKGYIKELISNGDERLQEALDKFEEGGDTGDLEQLVSNGLLSKKTSIDLLEDLDFHFLQQAGLEQLEGQEPPPEPHPTVHSTPAQLPVVSSSSSMSIPSANWRRGNELTLDDIGFDEFDEDEPDRRDRSDSVTSVNSMSGFGVNGSNISPSMLGQNFPDVFDDMNENRLSNGSNGGRPNTRPSSRRNVLTISTASLTCTPSSSAAIDIPRKNRGNQIAALVDAGMVADRMEEFANLDSLAGGEVEGPHYVGAYSPESRRRRVARFLEKRGRRIWTKKVKYDVRKNFADSRMRVKGRFVRKEDEELLRDLLSLT